MLIIFGIITLIIGASSYSNIAIYTGLIAVAIVIFLAGLVIAENKVREETYKQAIKDMHNNEVKYRMYLLPNKDTIFYKKR